MKLFSKKSVFTAYIFSKKRPIHLIIGLKTQERTSLQDPSLLQLQTNRQQQNHHNQPRKETSGSQSHIADKVCETDMYRIKSLQEVIQVSR